MDPIENGKDALALNAKFATLTASSSCTDGENACVGSGFAQCVGGKFVITQCAGGLTCAALPLVNKRGTVSFFVLVWVCVLRGFMVLSFVVDHLHDAS